MKNGNVLILAGFILFFIGCGKQSTIQTDVEADKAALRSIFDQWNKNALAGNYEANVQFYQKNGLRMNSQGILEGQSAIRASMKDFHEKNKLTQCNNVVEDIRVSGDLAVIRGSFTGTYVPKEGGEAVDMEGPLITIYERQSDGSWKSPFGLYAELEK